PWISAAGGWLNPATIPAFVDYAAKLSAALKERVYLWNTFNEPDTYASLTYLSADFRRSTNGNFCNTGKL
ncbi:MAG TPA: family 1 glycosylhydrolase, partial [Verrucomicrobiae bacterium]|nr:family 1 glycosylhydrolase [Verrucomicrobiae bacterium]